MLGECTDFDGLQVILRHRAATVAADVPWIDRVSRLHNGQAGKVLSANPTRRLTADLIGPLLICLGLKLVVVEDPKSFAKYRARLEPRNRRQAKNAADANQARISRIKLDLLRVMGIGGKKRFANMTTEQISEYQRRTALARWRPRRRKLITA
jgi:hypothetical protein